MPSNLKSVNIYTDGVCSGNPGPGGWAAILRWGEHTKEISGYVADTTNNRMELTAAIMALRELKHPCRVHLYSDSAYLVSAFNASWLDKWQQNGWKNATGQDVSNIDLWQELLTLSSVHDITWHKVKGHANNEDNNRCDHLAVRAIQQAQELKEESYSAKDSNTFTETILSAETMFKGKVFDVHHYQVSLEDGSAAKREVVRHAGGSTIVALTAQREIIFVQQFRIAAGQMLLELPAGKLDHKEEPLACAQRELKEETGYTAESWQHLYSFYPTPGYSDELIHLFLARQLTGGKQQLDQGEFLSVQLISLAEAISLIQEGVIQDAKTALGILLTQIVLQEEGSLLNE